MDKNELKSDIIREKIADGIIYIKDNGKKFFYFFVFAIITSGIYIYTTNNNQTIINEEKEKTSTKINQIEELLLSNETFKQIDGDSTLLITYNHPLRENFIQDSLLVIIKSMPQNDIQSLLLYMHGIKSFNLENLEVLLEDNPIDNDDSEMLNYIIILSQILIEMDSDKKIELLKECINVAPSYDIKVYRSIDLVDLYLDLNEIADANKIVSNCFIYYDKLSFNAQNELNYINGKIKMLNK